VSGLVDRPSFCQAGSGALLSASIAENGEWVATVDEFFMEESLLIEIGWSWQMTRLG
jgi:hypothetical protein